MKLVAFDKNVHNCKFASLESLIEFASTLAQQIGASNSYKFVTWLVVHCHVPYVAN
jgi:hypothetical protein